jgi:hypothetical protein
LQIWIISIVRDIHSKTDRKKDSGLSPLALARAAAAAAAEAKRKKDG